MHEVVAVQGMVHTIPDCLHKAGGTKVTNVHLVLGTSGHSSAEAVLQHTVSAIDITRAGENIHAGEQPESLVAGERGHVLPGEHVAALPRENTPCRI